MGNIISRMIYFTCCCESQKDKQEKEIRIIYEKIKPVITISEPVISV